MSSPESPKEIEEKTDYVLPSYCNYFNDGTIYRKTQKQIKTVLVNAGIETNVTRPGCKGSASIVGFHSLRHTFISKHAELGTPLAIIQESVGHSNNAMTQHYIQVAEQKVKDAAKHFKI